MADVITGQEVLKIARLSNLFVSDEEINQITNQLDSVLSYAARVKKVEGSQEIFSDFATKTNKTRVDVVYQISSQELLALVPEKEGSLIVVPMILETV